MTITLILAGLTLALLGMAIWSGLHLLQFLGAYGHFSWTNLRDVVGAYWRYLFRRARELDWPEPSSAWCATYCAIWLSTGGAGLLFFLVCGEVWGLATSSAEEVAQRAHLFAEIMLGLAMNLFHAASMNKARHDPQFAHA